MISHKHRCIFVHIPKTAGNSINRIFGISWENHKDLARYSRECDPVAFADYFKFAIVRNPWDRMLSDYNYQKKKSRPKDSKLHLFTESGAIRSFKEWVEKVLSDPFQYAPAQWGADISEGLHRWSPQVDWVSLNGKVAVDEILKLENLAESFPAVCRRLGMASVCLPRRNRRFHWHYSHYFDNSTRALVSRYYAKDIQRFGYRFESADDSMLWKLLRVCIRRGATSA